MNYRPLGAAVLLRRNLLIYGLGGIIVPFIGIKLIDLGLVLVSPDLRDARHVNTILRPALVLFVLLTS